MYVAVMTYIFLLIVKNVSTLQLQVTYCYYREKKISKLLLLIKKCKYVAILV